MRPAVRKFALIVHVTSSIGWLGAVVAFLALASAGLTSGDAAFVRSAYVAMAFVGWYVIVPFGAAALVTGVIQSVGTEWGLFQHYWVAIKFLLTIGSAALLPMHLRVASRLSGLALQQPLADDDLRGLRLQIAGDAAAAVLVLLIATTLSVYKPWGKIGVLHPAAYQRAAWGRYALIAMAALVLIAVVLHLAGRSMHLH